MFECADTNFGMVMTGLCEMMASLELVGESWFSKANLDTSEVND